MRRSWLQVLALLPLPVIAALVVHAGRRPVSQLLPPLEAAAGSGTGSAAAGLTLPAVPAPRWKLDGAPTRYDQKTLFDRIDGAAPVYIRAGFVGSFGGDYRKQGAREPITFDVYDMSSGRQALGMYATERDPSYNFVPVGDEGYLASGSLNFWRGRYYVKLAGQEQGEGMDRDLLELARGLAAALPAAPEIKRDLLELGSLPPGQLPNTVGYSHPPLGDVEGLAGAYYADYKAGETRYRLFIIRDASAGGAAARLDKAKLYFEKDKAKIEESRQGEARLVLAGGEGTTSLLVQTGVLLGGALDLAEASLVETIRPALLKSLTGPGRAAGAQKQALEKR